MRLRVIARDADTVQATLSTAPTPDDASASRLRLTVPLDIPDAADWAGAEGRYDAPADADANESADAISLSDRGRVLVPEHILIRLAAGPSPRLAAVHVEGMFTPLADDGPPGPPVRVAADVLATLGR